jgi:DNA-binding PadR family transcriptional regulator
MSRQSQTEMAVLGALSVEPMSGYAVRQAITETLGHFWSESFGQIYPTLARLEAEGFVVRDADGRTSGSTFRLTSAGRTRLVTLLREPIPAAPPRNGTLLRLFFGGLLGDTESSHLIDGAEAEARSRLERLTAIRDEVESDTDPDARYRLATVAAGQHAARAQLAWAQEARVLLAAVTRAR